MTTLNTIIKEIKDVSVSRLEELYQFVHSLFPKNKKTDDTRKKILSFGGAFSDMDANDYHEFVDHTKKTRMNLFSRNVDL